MSSEYKGSCLCGEVSFSVSGFSKRAANCHCSMCRKFHGAAFGTLVGVHNLVWLSGKTQLKEFNAPNGTTRTFCMECGSSIGFRVKDAALKDTELAIALFDDEIPVVIDAQMYTKYKASWSELQSAFNTFLEGRE